MKLETDRLILRDFVKGDWQRVLEYQSDPLYLRYNDWSERTPEAAQGFVGLFLDHQIQEPRIKFQLAIVLKSQNQMIGNCGVRMNKVDALDADVGYELDPKHWNHGYATEAAGAMMDFGFSRLGVHRTWASCIAENVGSAHVLEKLGMRLEGHLRENKYFKGRWWDTLIYATLADEWDLHKQSHPLQWKEIKE